MIVEQNAQIIQRAVAYIAQQLAISSTSIKAVLSLFDAGATIPFIARYRKEKTGSLDEVKIQEIKNHFDYFNELSKRKITILSTILELNKLTPKLEATINNCYEKSVLEDIYLPYKPRKITRADSAKEQGLQPLATMILAGNSLQKNKVDIYQTFLNQDKIKTVEDALLGALDIIAQQLADDSEIRVWTRTFMQKSAFLETAVTKNWKDKVSKYEMYYKYSEVLSKVSAHRILAIQRAHIETVITWKLRIDHSKCLSFLISKVIFFSHHPFITELTDACEDSFKRLLFPSIEKECFSQRVAAAEVESIAVFSSNLKHLLLASPVGPYAILGIDPGFRTGSKCAVINNTGMYQESVVIYLEKEGNKSEEIILALHAKYIFSYIAIGNGTGSKETLAFINDLIIKNKLSVKAILVNESGASIYSASDIAREEFPHLDLTIRSAISIGRRLQDPLAELIKTDPKSMGIGQYQHDLNQKNLIKSLDFIVEYCVNYVGVDLNTASSVLLSHVSGIGALLAKNIIEYREQIGVFSSRNQLKQVPGLGLKTFEQCAGFLRIRNSRNPLDNTAIHPEAYSLVQVMATKNNVQVSMLIQNNDLLNSLNLSEFVTDTIGLPTLSDMIVELKKPGRDPRTEFKYATFRKDINDINDLTKGLILEGRVTNVTNFGAFVDIGVHQDGLIHISKLSTTFVKNPAQVIAVGENITVVVIEADQARKRISLQRVFPEVV